MSDEKTEPKTILDEKLVKYTPEESKRLGSAIMAEMKNNPTETGAKIIALATRRQEKIFLETVINRAQELVSHRNNLYIALEKTQREIALFDKRIAAVEAGEFRIDHQGRIIWNDILLNY